MVRVHARCFDRLQCMNGQYVAVEVSPSIIRTINVLCRQEMPNFLDLNSYPTGSCRIPDMAHCHEWRIS